MNVIACVVTPFRLWNDVSISSDSEVIIIIIIIIIIVPHRRKEARWSNTRPMAERQDLIFMLGRDGHMPSSRIIRHWVRREAGAAAELAASRKEENVSIGSEYLFAPIAVETLGPMNTSACQLFANLGRKISSASGDDREGAFLFQRISVLVQRYNAVLLHDTLPATDCTNR